MSGFCHYCETGHQEPECPRKMCRNIRAIVLAYVERRWPRDGKPEGE